MAKPFALATTAPFLLAAGCGTLPAPTLCKWLVQDIHYARAYVRFVGGLIAKLRLGTGLGATTFGSRGLAGEGSVDEGQEGKVNGAEIGEGARANNAGRERERVMEKAFDLLVKALVNIQQEMRFFDDAVARYGLELQRKEMGGVMKGYADLFEKIGAQGDGGLLEGMVVLWGMEYVSSHFLSFNSLSLCSLSTVNPVHNGSFSYGKNGGCGRRLSGGGLRSFGTSRANARHSVCRVVLPKSMELRALAPPISFSTTL